MARYGDKHIGGRRSKAEELKLVEAIISSGTKKIGKDPLDILWGKIWEQAEQGSVQHQKFILEYAYGKPKQIVSIEDNSLQINITKGDS